MTISREERERRCQAIRELMNQDGLGSLVIAGRADHLSRGNIRYVTGYGPIVGPQYCVFPLEGRPIFVARSTPFLATLRERDWDLEYKLTTDHNAEVLALVAELDTGHRVGIVGLSDIPVPLYLALRERFEERLVDATWIFRQLRTIKSAEEIEKMRISASVADEVFNRLKELARPGISDFEIYGEVRRIIHQRGCEYSMELINSEGTRLNFFYPTGNRLEANGTLSVEITPAYEGYFTQLPVTVPVGEYPPQILAMIAVWQEALERATSILRPGTVVSDVHRAMIEPIQEAGYVAPWRCGHAIGLDVIDFWGVDGSNATTLEPGMTLTVHPGLLVESLAEGFAMGYTYLIAESGHEKLNGADLRI
jgi:Xaa-Pro aminopeptidase